MGTTRWAKKNPHKSPVTYGQILSNGKDQLAFEKLIFHNGQSVRDDDRKISLSMTSINVTENRVV